MAQSLPCGFAYCYYPILHWYVCYQVHQWFFRIRYSLQSIYEVTVTVGCLFIPPSLVFYGLIAGEVSQVFFMHSQDRCLCHLLAIYISLYHFMTWSYIYHDTGHVNEVRSFLFGNEALHLVSLRKVTVL